ncbi:hypothetical protein BDV19DRAFT_70296 [Aspergillus venezuelensis]
MPDLPSVLVQDGRRTASQITSSMEVSRSEEGTKAAGEAIRGSARLSEEKAGVYEVRRGAKEPAERAGSNDESVGADRHIERRRAIEPEV